MAGLLVAPLLAVLAACGGGDAPAAPALDGAGSARLRLSASVAVGAEARTVRIIVRYRRIDGEDAPLPSEPSSVTVVAGDTKEQPVVVNLGPCLADPRRLPSANNQCVLRVEMQLLTSDGQLIATDVKDAGAVAAGSTVAPVGFTLGPPVITVSPAAVAFGGTSEFAVPDAQVVRISAVRADGAPAGAAAGTISVTPAFDGGVEPWLAPRVDQAAGTITLQPTRSTLAPGSYTATLTVASSIAGVQPRTVAVTYQLRAPLTLTVAGAGIGAGRVTAAGGIDCAIDAGRTTGGCAGRFQPGASVTLTAAPAPGHRFDGWSPGCAEPAAGATCTVALSEARTVTARFTPPAQTLTITGVGPGAGSVGADKGGVDCSVAAGGRTSGTCVVSLPFGTVVTLLATPAQHNAFTGWGGGACVGSGPCTVTLDRPLTVSAGFAAIVHGVSVSVGGPGAGRVSGPGIDCVRGDGGAVGGTCSTTAAQGTTLSFTATPAPDNVFTGWTGACSGTGACAVQVTGPQSVGASFAPAPRALSVSVAGTGSGSVASSVGGIACQLVAGAASGTCSATLPHGTVVTLSAGADAATSVFVGWSGACAGAGATCTVTLDQARGVGATFALVARQLVVRGTGSGTVTIAADGRETTCTIVAGQAGAGCSFGAVHGVQVRLRATPAANNVFGGWAGPCSGQGECTLLMVRNHEVVAAFGPTPRTLTVLGAGTGAGTVSSTPAGIDACATRDGTTCSSVFAHGTVVTLAAAASPGSVFAGWSGACAGAASCTVPMDQAQSVTARFELLHTLTVAGAGSGSGTVNSSDGRITCTVTAGTATGTCSATYIHGTAVTLTAAPNATTSAFGGWSGACAGTAPCTVTVTATAAVTATFALQTRTLTVSGAGAGSGTITSGDGRIVCTVTAGATAGTCSATYTHGTAVTLTATPNAATSTFTGWSGVCAGTAPCAVTMTADAAATATFALRTYALTVSGAGSGSGTVTSSDGRISCSVAAGAATGACSATYTHGTAVTLTAVPNAATSTFTGWSGACAGTAPCTVTVTATAAVTATFALQARRLTVSGAGGGSGTVRSNVGGIDCVITLGVASGTCSATYAHGEVVTLTATASGNYVFGSWGADCAHAGAGAGCTVTMDRDRSASARFEPPVLRAGAASISGPSITWPLTSSGPTIGGLTRSHVRTAGSTAQSLVTSLSSTSTPSSLTGTCHLDDQSAPIGTTTSFRITVSASTPVGVAPLELNVTCTVTAGALRDGRSGDDRARGDRSSAISIRGGAPAPQRQQ